MDCVTTCSARMDNIIGDALLAIFPQGKSVRLVNKHGKIIVQSDLKENEFEYLISKKMYNCKNISENNIITVNLSTTSQNKILPAYYFYDINSNKILSGVIKANRNEYIQVPENAIFIKFGIRVSATCEEEIKGIFFSPVDSISTHVLHKNGIACRFIVNNLNKKGKGVIVFFASARVNSGVYPVYSRHTWWKYLPSFCSICVADPYELDSDCVESRGSWYIGSDGKSAIPVISDCIKEIIGPTHGPIVTYGSSMGGYASILCGYFINADAVVAECPQVDLTTYRHAKIRLSKLKNYDNDIINIFDFWRTHPYKKKVDIYINTGDIYHIKSFIDNLTHINNVDTVKSMDIRINLFKEKNSFGHVALSADVAPSIIDQTFKTLS